MTNISNLKFQIVLGTIFLSLLFPKFAFAHVLETNGNIGAVLHIDPADDPIVGQRAGFFFEFKDKENKFTPQNCDCVFSILENEKEIYSQPLFQNNSNPSLSNASAFFTFPKKDVYTIKVTGKPITAGSFEPFVLSYDIRLERESNNSNSSQTEGWISQYLPHIIAGGIILVLLGISFIKNEKSNIKN